MMRVIIQRLSDDGKECKGVLTVTDPNITLFSCDTLERPNLGNKPDISNIPCGIYQCRWGFMDDLHEPHYQILNVPNRTKIFIHEGNFVSNTEGCILLGSAFADINNDGEKDIVNSRNTLKEFENTFVLNNVHQSFEIAILDVPSALT